MRDNFAQDDEPWYRQFWPWFLISLPATVVVAGLMMVYTAFHNADSLVNDNYYRDGLAINLSLGQDKVASDLGLTAEVKIDSTSGELFVTLVSAEAGAPQLELLLLHPTDERGDQTLLLNRVAANYYRTDLEYQLQYRYYLQLLPLPERQWRLRGEINFSSADMAILQAQ